MYKICKECGGNKLLSEFREYAPGKFRPECKKCESLLSCQLYHMKYKYERNKDDMKKKREEFFLKFPWMKNIYSARNRCNNPNKDNYKYYGEKGIKCELSNKDGEYLWFRDKAYLMNEPTLDRLNSKGNYTVNNCQFLEKKEHDLKTQRENSFQCIKITQLDENNEVMKRWSSKSQITRLNGFSWNGLQRALDKNKLYKGFYWKYA